MINFTSFKIKYHNTKFTAWKSIIICIDLKKKFNYVNYKKIHMIWMYDILHNIQTLLILISRILYAYNNNKVTMYKYN